MTLLSAFLRLFGIIQDPETIEQARTRIALEQLEKEPCYFFHGESENGRCKRCLITVGYTDCEKLNN
jgi:hypothetical protein